VLLLLLSCRAAGPAPAPGGASLGPADLADGAIDRSSFAGSHSYLSTARREAGLGRLYWRQFSDWSAAPGVGGGHPLFDPILALDEKPLGDRTIRGYRWRPDYVEYAADYASGLRASTRTGYLGVDALFAQVGLENAGAAPLRLVFAGAASKFAKAELEAAEDSRRLRIDLEASPPNLWDAPPSPFRRRCEVRVSGGALRPTWELGYEAVVELAPGERRTFAATFADGHDPAAADAFWRDPGAVPDAATRAVAAWLAEAPVPASVTDPRIRRMAYNSWFQFWYNTQHAEGLWKSAIITPSRSSYGRGIWLWDTAFHVLALVHGGPAALKLAEEQVLALIRSAHPDGHLPREVWVGVANPEIQAPGVLTWAALDVHRRTGRRAFLEEVYPVFAANNRWYYAERDANGNGLAEWCEADSGWDTSPRWDVAKEGKRRVPVDAVDLNAWLKLDQDCLAEMADRLGRPGEAAEWRARAGETARRMRELMWEDADGFYYDLNPLADGAKIRVRTPHTYWTLLARIATPEQAARMLPHLDDPKLFGTPWPMPCVAASDPAFEPNNYWRGPVWVNLNWLTIRGLEAYGHREAARKLRRRTIALILNDPTPREYYNPLTGGGLGAHNYMWTGALFLAMMEEDESP
jgi:hypothetical protein